MERYAGKDVVDVFAPLHIGKRTYGFGMCLSGIRQKLQFPCDIPQDVEQTLSDPVAWDNKMAIRGTPTFWMNGKEITGILSRLDLIEQLPIIIEDHLETSPKSA